jgi:hypothetical protein
MSQNRYIRRLLIAIGAIVVFATHAGAQTTMNPTRAEFNPSADHSATSSDGTPIVSSYRLDLFLQGASAPFQSSSLGKPNPDPDGIVRVNLTSVFVGWPVPGTVYTADVAAVGPGGAAPSALSNAFGFTGPCSYTASPTSNTLASGGGTGTVNVTSGTGCAWTATSNAGWITITGGASGSGNGPVTYSVAANTGAQRTGTMTVAGQTITITQSAPCSFTVSPTSLNSTSAGGTGSTSVTTTSACNWTATSNASWITVTSGGSGSGNGTVNFSVAANTGAQRNGTLTVAGQTVTITQAAPCSYTVSPTANTLASAGGTGSTSVTTTSACSWTATSNAGWITVTSGGSGTGNGTVNYSVAANTGAQRTGTLTVAGQTVTITQNAPCTYSVSPTT